MAGVNKCIFIGNVGADPEQSRKDDNTRTTLRIACNESWKDKVTGEKKERTEWIPLVAFGRMAEVIGDHVKKGDTIYVEGKYQTRKWQDTSGQDRYFTEIMVGNFQFVKGRGDNAQPQQATQERNEQEHRHGIPSDGFDDDIPF